MVFCHIGTGHQDAGLTQQTELTDAAGSCTADDKVGCLIGLVHTTDEVGHIEIGWLALCLKLFRNVFLIVATCLPDELHGSCSDLLQRTQHTLVKRPCPQTAAN